MFCSNCGQANPDDSKFCVSCGTALETQEENEQVSPQESINEEAVPAEEVAAEGTDFGYVPDEAQSELAKAPLTTKIILGVIAGVIVLLVIGLLSAFGVFKHGSEKVLDRYVNARLKGDGKALYAAEVDPYRLENALDNDFYNDEDEYIEEYIDRAEDLRDSLEDTYGDNIKASYEIRKITKYDSDDIEELDEWLSDNYDYPEGALKDLRVIKIRTVVEGEDGRDRDTSEVITMKIGRKWYISTVFQSKPHIEVIIDD